MCSWAIVYPFGREREVPERAPRSAIARLDWPFWAKTVPIGECRPPPEAIFSTRVPGEAGSCASPGEPGGELSHHRRFQGRCGGITDVRRARDSNSKNSPDIVGERFGNPGNTPDLGNCRCIRSMSFAHGCGQTVGKRFDLCAAGGCDVSGHR